jgi:hypothetical protein
VPAVLITGDLSTEVPARCQGLGIRIAYKPLPAGKLTQLITDLLAERPAQARPGGRASETALRVAPAPSTRDPR